MTSAEGALLAAILFIVFDALLIGLVLWGLGRLERSQPGYLDEE